MMHAHGQLIRGDALSETKDVWNYIWKKVCAHKCFEYNKYVVESRYQVRRNEVGNTR